MNNTDLKLGWILALLEGGNDITHQPLSQEQHRHIERMREHLKGMASGAAAKKINTNIPHTTCPVEKPFLAGNQDFFLEVFLNHHKEPLCLELAAHLNCCYACFEIFSQVLREYYYKRDELSTKSKTQSYE